MSTTQPALNWQEPRKAPGNQPEAPPDHDFAAEPRTPRPRVLARFPDLDAPAPSPEPAPGFPELGGRIINQKLAGRILGGIAVVLVLTAVLPLAFRRGGSEEHPDQTEAKPSWQPENPAPDAALAPAWNDAATQVDERMQPREQASVEPAPPLEPETPAERPQPSPLRDTERTASREAAEPIKPAPDSPAPLTGNGEPDAAANQGQSIAPRNDAGSDLAPDDRFARPDWAEADRQHPAATSTANRETAIPEADPPGAGHRDAYQPAQPEASYGREPGWGSGYDLPSRSENPHAPRSGGYHPAPQTNYRAGPGQDYRAAPGQDYRSERGHDYRSTPGQDFRAAPGQDYRSAPGHHHRAAPGHDYRSAPVADSRSAPGAEYRSPSAAEGPAQPYRSSPGFHQPAANPYGPSPHTQPAPGYREGSGAGTAPSGTSPYYQADRQYGAGAEYAPYHAQPAEAHFRGTIEQPPAPNRYENSGSRLY